MQRALFLCVLLCAHFTSSQDTLSSSNSTTESNDEDFDAAFDSLLSQLETQSVFGISPNSGGVVLFTVPKNRITFPDLLITLDVTLPSMDVDMYCKPGSPAQYAVGSFPYIDDYVWKSDHAHGTDYIFISRYHPEYASRTGNVNGVEVAYFLCTFLEISGMSSTFRLSIDAEYEDRDLISNEQRALQSIFDACCQEEDACTRWKEHINQSNAMANDFCHFETNICDSDGHLTVMNLDNMNMNCPFPGKELKKFKTLKKLRFLGNSFEGNTEDVLRQIAELENVQRIEISEAKFKGPLIEDINDENAPICQLARTRALLELILTESNISGSLPACLFEADATLRSIHLGGNRLSGKLPRLSSSSNASLDIVLERNQLSGELLPDWLNFKNLQLLDLSHNRFTGDVPDEFYNLKSIQDIQLDHNRFFGPFPVSLFNVSSLVLLRFDNNQFSGPLPDDKSDPLKNAAKLVYLNASFNDFEGNLSKSFAALKELSLLVLRNNRLSGNISEDLFSLPGLRMLDLTANAFDGDLPLKLSNARQLMLLLLGSNAFTGSIPEEWGTLQNLQLLKLENNQIHGEIPGWIWSTTSNPLITPVPIAVDLSGNLLERFEGSWYQKSLFNSRIVTFDASDNAIKGDLPQNLAKQDTLRYLNLGGNQMSGQLLGEKGDFENVLYLNLSSNYFTSTIPKEWNTLALFQSEEETVMDLSYNELEGKIPSFVLGKGQTSEVIREFYLQGNNFAYTCPVETEKNILLEINCDSESKAEAEENAKEKSVNEAQPSVPASKERDTVSTVRSSPQQSNEEGKAALTIRGSNGPASERDAATVIPILAAFAALFFALSVCAIAIIIKSYRSHKKDDNLRSIPMTTLDTPTSPPDDFAKLRIGESSAKI